MAAVQSGGTVRVARAREHRVSMDQASSADGAVRSASIHRIRHGSCPPSDRTPTTRRVRISKMACANSRKRRQLRGLRTCVRKDCGGDAIGESSRTIWWCATGPSITSCRPENCRRTRSRRSRASWTDELFTTVPLRRNQTRRRRDGSGLVAGSRRCTRPSLRRLLLACLLRRPGRRGRRPRGRDRSGSRRS